MIYNGIRIGIMIGSRIGVWIGNVNSQEKPLKVQRPDINKYTFTRQVIINIVRSV